VKRFFLMGKGGGFLTQQQNAEKSSVVSQAKAGKNRKRWAGKTNKE